MNGLLRDGDNLAELYIIALYDGELQREGKCESISTTAKKEAPYMFPCGDNWHAIPLQRLFHTITH